jgi:hypothetical protein
MEIQLIIGKVLPGDEFPSKGWEIKDGKLRCMSSGGNPEKRGDILLPGKNSAHLS